MLERVYERVSMARYLSKVVIATDDERIFANAIYVHQWALSFFLRVIQPA